MLHLKMSSIGSSRAYFMSLHSPPSSPGPRSPASPSSPTSYIIYRNHKYYGFIKRVFHYSLILIRHYVRGPISKKLIQIQDCLLELFGFICVLILGPLLILSSIGLYISRLIRRKLIQRFYRELTVCEDFSLRSVFGKPQSEIVTGIVWVNGKVSAAEIQQKYLDTRIQVLEKCISRKYGLQCFSTPKLEPASASQSKVEYYTNGTNGSLNNRNTTTNSNINTSPAFPVTNHIVGCPTSCSFNTNGKHDDSKLQNIISSVISKDLNDGSKPPWEIVLIPLISLQQSYGCINRIPSKPKTCVVLRFHYIFSSDPKVIKFLDSTFSRNPLNTKSSQIFQVSEDPLSVLINYGQRIWAVSKAKLLRQNDFLTSFLLEMQSWWKLQRIKLMYHFHHTKLTEIPILIWYQLVSNVQNLLNIPIEFCKTCFCKESLNIFLHLVNTFGLLVRSSSFIPSELLKCFINQRFRYKCATSSCYTSYYGFSPLENNTRQLAWSSSISKEFLEEIQAKSGCSAETVILSAVSIALERYYIEMNLPNPGTIGYSVIKRSSMDSQNSFKSASINIKQILYGNERHVLQASLDSYPSWKVFGTLFLLTYISYILPRCFAIRILRLIYCNNPVAFCSGHENDREGFKFGSSNKGIVPSLSLWDFPVDELTIWDVPQDDSCISLCLVEATETMRLFVNSPMKALATSLTKHLDIYLNYIAEVVGVEKTKIIYSRRNSPYSSQQ